MPAAREKKVTCRTPTPGKKPTRIDLWKYDLVRAALLKLIPKKGDGIVFRELPKLAAQSLKTADLKRLGSVSWYVTVVKLNMEVVGELSRVPDSNPQRLLRQ